jgi:endonuclease/exonuclease/phosphatase family metal-dependent hydrolase
MVRLLSWNIHKGIGGLDRRYAPGRIAAVVRHYKPDVLLLQEVDDGVPRSARDRQVDLLGDVLEFPHRAFGPNVWLKRGCYGNATLSRFPILASHNLDLTFPLKKPRGALYTELELDGAHHGTTLHVMNLHLGLAGVERRWQVRRMLARAPLVNLAEDARVIVAGDTNDWAGSLSGGALSECGFECATGRGVHASRTFPAWRPMGALDRVFLRGPLGCKGHYCSRLALARAASDHLPLIVELELRS